MLPARTNFVLNIAVIVKQAVRMDITETLAHRNACLNVIHVKMSFRANHVDRGDMERTAKTNAVQTVLDETASG